MNNYEERQKNRAEYYQEKADKFRRLATEESEQAIKMVKEIPLGQPILIGHHSEKRHRKHNERVDNKMRKSVEYSKKADYYEQKAKATENNKAISSDDPEALRKLKEKLQKAQEEHQKYKDHNKKNPKDRLPAYVLANSNARIRSIKKRIESEEKKKQFKNETISGNGYEIIIDNEVDNRIKILFNDIPSEEVRTMLKKSAFRWSRKNSAWQRKITGNAMYSLKVLSEKLKEIYN